MKKSILVLVVLLGIVGAYYFRKYKQRPVYLYKIITPETMEKSSDKDCLILPEFDQEFIHFATKDQVPKIISKFFKGVPRVYMLKLDVAQLPGRLVKERNPGGVTDYYHLYDGFIPHLAIVETIEY